MSRVNESNFLQHFVAALFSFLPAQPVKLSEELKIVDRVQFVVDRVFLRNDAEKLALLQVATVEFLSIEQHFTGAGGEQSGYHHHGGTLAGTVWSQQSQDLPSL